MYHLLHVCMINSTWSYLALPNKFNKKHEIAKFAGFLSFSLLHVFFVDTCTSFQLTNQPLDILVWFRNINEVCQRDTNTQIWYDLTIDFKIVHDTL